MGFYKSSVRVNISLEYWTHNATEDGKNTLLHEYGNLEAVILEALWICGQLHDENKADIMTVYENIEELCEDLFTPMFLDEWELEIDESVGAVYGLTCMVKDCYPGVRAYCNYLSNLDFDFTRHPDYIADVSWHVIREAHDDSLGDSEGVVLETVHGEGITC